MKLQSLNCITACRGVATGVTPLGQMWRHIYLRLYE